MTDRELLEAAAKAAGIELGADRFDCAVSVTHQDGRHESLPRWNPLNDDGDTLRLAVALDIEHFRRDGHIHAQVYWRDDIISDVIKVNEPIGKDPCAATRRAIVRAAAAIGEQK